MLKSMTGYGAAKGEFAGIRLSVELKSVNNRFLDVTVRTPKSCVFAEDALKSAVKEAVSRGKVDVFVTADESAADAAEVTVNLPLAEGYIRALSELRGRFGLADAATAVDVSRLPEVLVVTRRETDRDALRETLVGTLSLALAEFNSMRETEGASLRRDLEARLDRVEELTAFIELRSPETVRAYRERLSSRMTELLESAGIDEQRILLEAAIFADRIDVSEETVRLRSHAEQMRELLKKGSPAGRKLEFIMQELNREVNTCGSKASDAALCATVIELKSELEKIREQIQNIE